jgi:hypothetical protein
MFMTIMIYRYESRQECPPPLEQCPTKGWLEPLYPFPHLVQRHLLDVVLLSLTQR